MCKGFTTKTAIKVVAEIDGHVTLINTAVDVISSSALETAASELINAKSVPPQSLFPDIPTEELIAWKQGAYLTQLRETYQEVVTDLLTDHFEGLPGKHYVENVRIVKHEHFVVAEVNSQSMKTCAHCKLPVYIDHAKRLQVHEYLNDRDKHKHMEFYCSQFCIDSIHGVHNPDMWDPYFTCTKCGKTYKTWARNGKLQYMVDETHTEDRQVCGNCYIDKHVKLDARQLYDFSLEGIKKFAIHYDHCGDAFAKKIEQYKLKEVNVIEEDNFIMLIDTIKMLREKHYVVVLYIQNYPTGKFITYTKGDSHVRS